LYDYWDWNGLASDYFTCTRKGLTQILAEDPAENVQRSRGILLSAALMIYQNKLEDAIHLIEWGTSLSQSVEEKESLGRVLMELGDMMMYFKDTQAIQFLEKGIALYREVGYSRHLADGLMKKGLFYQRHEDFETADACFTECLHIYEELGDQWYVLWIWGKLGSNAAFQRKYDVAQNYIDKYNQTSSEAKDLNLDIMFRAIEVIMAQLQAKFDLLEMLCLNLLPLMVERPSLCWLQRVLARAVKNQGEGWRAAGYFMDSLKIAQSIGESYGQIIALAGVGGGMAQEGQMERAACLLGSAEVLLEKHLRMVDPLDKQEFDLDKETVRAALDENTFQEAWEKGRSMTLEQAIGEAHAFIQGTRRVHELSTNKKGATLDYFQT
jgi:tetratricopeptide (TPR) repeat protein